MASSNSGYVNPLHRISGLSYQRIDQGVDFTGHGPILAIGNGKVLAAQAHNAGWPGGGWMTYVLTDGPLKGQIVYVAEEITPTVSAGATVQAGQHIADMHGFIETGWAANANTTLSQTPGAGNISGANLPGGGSNPTAVGKNFDQLLVSLGVRRAPNFNNPVGGKLPSSLVGQAGVGGTTTLGASGGPSTIKPIFSPIDLIPGFSWIGNYVSGFSGIPSNIGAVASGIEGFVDDFQLIVKWSSWLFQPANWIRIASGIGGAMLFIAATLVLIWAAR